MSKQYEAAMRMAINAAEKFVGATSPNPPVGCIALDKAGKVLLGAAHQKAGTAHAEAAVLNLAQKLGKAEAIHTLVVTLEPCNHRGRTPPCVEAILKQKNIRRVVIGCRDPNPEVAGGGVEALRKAGLEVIESVLEQECKFLIRAFAKFVQTKRPYVTLKAAFTRHGSMVPPAGQKTFTSDASLLFAHELRKRADALWTGSSTVIADNPEFTVRWVPDHPGKKRILVLSDRRRRVSQEWIKKAQGNGFTVHLAPTLDEGLDYLGKQGVLEVLVETGPELREAWLQSGLWDESVVITQGQADDDEDEDVRIEFRDAPEDE
ncbi:MAG: bifunctional diaminohydroxyphosphoribosylaminopyrimidine deaminase/5-amino-6-(5-phosphoribosylamino)uracil reductase RibD [Proteobacteria bacterium]|nr:MAG: bifunctional diaminohydroxyphosphoribosylaminopyrimidine deaminase/5-amino-6-(5-phosphoribosylamino)uracil reductase RibD [Pseudomonadota bacterium]